MKIKLELLELLNSAIEFCNLNFNHVLKYDSYTFWHRDFIKNKAKIELEIKDKLYVGYVIYNGQTMFSGSSESLYRLFEGFLKSITYIKSN